MGVAAPSAGYPKRPLHLVLQFLQHAHEFFIHFVEPTSTEAGHFRDGEIAGDHLRHEDSRGEEEGPSAEKNKPVRSLNIARKAEPDEAAQDMLGTPQMA